MTSQKNNVKNAGLFNDDEVLLVQHAENIQSDNWGKLLTLQCKIYSEMCTSNKNEVLEINTMIYINVYEVKYTCIYVWYKQGSGQVTQHLVSQQLFYNSKDLWYYFDFGKNSRMKRHTSFFFSHIFLPISW